MKRRRQHGYTMILAMLVLIALTAIGVFALRTSRTDFLVSKSQRIATLANYIAEAGLLYVQRHPTQSDANLLLKQITAYDGGLTLTYPSSTLSGSLFGDDGGASAFEAFGYGSDLRPAFQVVISKPRSIPWVTGQGLGSGPGTKRCYWVFDYTSTGIAIGSKAMGADGGINWNDPGANASDRFGIAQIRAEVVQVGDCS